MNKESLHCCSNMTRNLNEKKAHIGYSPKVREYHIDLHNEPAIVYIISYCPWCGEKLPNSLRRKWFHTLEKEFNLDDPWNNEQETLIPEEFNSEKWWKDRKL